jgi:hypothetical protein
MMADEIEPTKDSRSRPDAAQIAALIDGRLTDDARASLMRQLGESEDDLDVAVDAAGAVGALGYSEQKNARPASIESRRWKRYRGISFATMSLAAAAVAVIVFRSPRPNDGTASEMVRGLSSHEALPAGWNYSPWREQRGEESVNDSSVLIRVGVRTTDLELALLAHDTSAARFARDIASMLDRVPGGSATGAIYAQLAANPRADEFLQNARAAMSALPRQQLIQLGAWLEAARIAAARHDRAWFERRINRHVVSRISPLRQFAAVDIAVATAINSGTYDWPMLNRLIESLIEAT